MTEQVHRQQEVPETTAQEPLQPHQHQPNPHQVMIVAAEAVEVQMTVKRIQEEVAPGVEENEKTSCYFIVVCRNRIWADS